MARVGGVVGGVGGGCLGHRRRRKTAQAKVHPQPRRATRPSITAERHGRAARAGGFRDQPPQPQVGAVLHHRNAAIGYGRTARLCARDGAGAISVTIAATIHLATVLLAEQARGALMAEARARMVRAACSRCRCWGGDARGGDAGGGRVVPREGLRLGRSAPNCRAAARLAPPEHRAQRRCPAARRSSALPAPPGAWQSARRAQCPPG